MTRLLVGTNNPGKLAEFRRLLASLDAEVVSPADIGLTLDVPEPHDSYAKNAAAKALAFAHASDLVTVADDSGIEVAALNGGPGVHSARFAPGGPDAGPDLVLERLRGAEDRTARMVCWLAVAVPDHDEPTVELFEGVVQGRVAAERRGRGGFGYDPIFELPDGRTTAELTQAEKDERSHRGQAVAAALPYLREVTGARDRMPPTLEDA